MAPPDAKTRIYVLVGNPVDHSLSPLIHNAAFNALKINSVYLACLVEKKRLHPALEGLRSLSAAGANITSPYKETVIPYLDSLSPEARLLSSVNTIINQNGRMHGETTDGEGFYRSLSEIVPERQSAHHSVMIVGAGGAARAAAYALARHGTKEFSVVNRTPEKGQLLSSILSREPAVNLSRYVPLQQQEIQRALKECSLIVYALPFDEPEFMAALSAEIPGSREQYLFDLRYHPARTAVMSAFEKNFGRAFNGLEMLLQQAAISFELFTGQKAPLKVMRKAINIQTVPVRQ